MLVIEYLPLAKYVASTIPKYNPLYTYDDIVSWACLGLIDAIERFDPDRGIKFETYAILRVRGSIIDNLRKLSPLHYKHKKKELNKQYEYLSQKLGRSPTDYEMAEELGMSIPKYRTMLVHTLPFQILSLDEVVDAEEHLSAVYKYLARGGKDFTAIRQLREQKELLAEAIGRLSERKRKIIVFYYYEGLTMKEIAEVLHLSEGRISQLHAHALIYLRKEIGSYS